MPELKRRGVGEVRGVATQRGEDAPQVRLVNDKRSGRTADAKGGQRRRHVRCAGVKRGKVVNQRGGVCVGVAGGGDGGATTGPRAAAPMKAPSAARNTGVAASARPTRQQQDTATMTTARVSGNHSAHK